MIKRNESDGMEKRLFTLEEAAAYLGMGKKSTRKYMDEINATRKFGSRVAFDKKVIDAALDRLNGGAYNISVVRSTH